MNPFKRATRCRVSLKTAITGPAGSTKTMSSLLMAMGLGNKIAVIDTENNSASLYSTLCDFDVLNISPPFTEAKLIDAIQAAVAAGYEILIIDSYSHFWEGAMDYKATLDARGSNSYTNWNAAGKKFRSTLEAILQSPIHVIVCMRSKMDYVLETDIRGKQVPKKVGLAPVMRPEIEYEFTLLLDGDAEHYVTASKDRTSLFTDQRFQVTPETGRKLLEWLHSVPESEPEPTVQEQLAAALTDIDPETLSAYLVARGASPDGLVLSVSDTYAQKALAALPRLMDGIAKFRQEAARTGQQSLPQ